MSKCIVQIQYVCFADSVVGLVTAIADLLFVAVCLATKGEK